MPSHLGAERFNSCPLIFTLPQENLSLQKQANRKFTRPFFVFKSLLVEPPLRTYYNNNDVIYPVRIILINKTNLCSLLYFSPLVRIPSTPGTHCPLVWVSWYCMFPGVYGIIWRMFNHTLTLCNLQYLINTRIRSKSNKIFFILL